MGCSFSDVSCSVLTVAFWAMSGGPPMALVFWKEGFVTFSSMKVFLRSTSRPFPLVSLPTTRRKDVRTSRLSVMFSLIGQRHPTSFIPVTQAENQDARSAVWGEVIVERVEVSAAAFYCQTFFDCFDRAACVPHLLLLQLYDFLKIPCVYPPNVNFFLIPCTVFEFASMTE